jgi:hypothetical protein
MNTDKLIEKFFDFLERQTTLENQGNKVTSEVDLPIVKSSDNEERRCLFLVLEPQDSNFDTADLHGDWYDADTIQKACHDYNQRCERIGIMHQEIASEEEVVVQESYISPCDFVTESGVAIKKGSWLMWLHFPSDAMWNDVKNGIYDSVSIECSATGYDIL